MLECLNLPMDSQALAVVAASVLFLYLIRAIARAQRRRSSRLRGLAQRKAALKKFEEVVQRLGKTDAEVTGKILGANAGELRDMLQTGEIKAVDAVRVLQRRALEITKEINCVTEVVEDAEARAMELDKLPKSQRGLLHGMPVSIKECCDVAGHAATFGVAKRLDQVATQDAALVALLRQHGAIPFVRTNIPQTMLTFDCSNPVYGESSHPTHRERSPGGSSGGEAALQAAGGSVFGLGSDIGGSARIPAHNCGTCGLKSTSPRLSKLGWHGPIPGQSGINSTPGPMARDVEGLVMLMRALCGAEAQAHDPNTVPLSFDEDEYASKRKLRIGYYTSDGWLKPQPVVQRAVALAVSKLEGHREFELVPFQPPRVAHAVELYFKLVSADKGTTVFRSLLDEVEDPGLAPLLRLIEIPDPVRPVLGAVLSVLPGFARSADILRWCRRKTVDELWALQHARDEYKREFLQHMEEAGIDVILGPGLPFPALRKRTASELVSCLSSTMLWNLLDLPAGVLPAARVSEDDENALHSWPSDFISSKAKKASQGGVGLPVSVQVVAKPWKDETVLRVMRELERALDFE